MTTLRFVLKRSIAQRSLGLAVVVTTAFTIGVLVAGPTYAASSREAIWSAAVNTSTVFERTVRFQIYAGVGFDWQSADATVADATRDLPSTALIRQGLATVTLAGRDAGSAPLLFRDGFQQHLTIVGKVPGPGEALLASTVARQMGLGPGDLLELVGPQGTRAELTVSGTYLPTSANPHRVTDPFWLGSRSPFPQPGSPDPQPIVVARDTGLRLDDRLGLSPQFVWDVFLQLDGRPYGASTSIPQQIDAARDAIQQRPGLGEMQEVTDLPTLLQLVRGRVGHLFVPILLVVFQVAAVALAVLAGVGSLVLSRQSFELAVLHSRGLSKRGLLVAQGAQGVVMALVALPLGLALGMGLAKLASKANGPTLPGVLFPIRLTVGGVLLASGAAVISVVLLLLLSVPLVRRTVLDERRAISREERSPLLRVPVEAFLLPVGVFAFVQLKVSPPAPTANGEIDPLLLIAPTLLVFAASFLALRGLLFVVRRLDGRIGRVRRAPVYLAGRRLGRSPGLGIAAALLLLLSMGLLVVSTSYRAIVLRSHQDAARQRVGSDWAVQASADDVGLKALRELPAGMTGIVRAVPVLPSGSFTAPPVALAIDPSTFPDAAWWRDDLSARPLSDLMSEMQTPPPGLARPAGSDVLTVSIRAPAVLQRVEIVAVTFDDRSGSIFQSTAGIQPGSTETRISISGGDRLLSLAIRSGTQLGLLPQVTVRLDGASLGGRPLDLSTWTPLAWRGGGGKVLSSAGGVALRFHPGAASVIGGLAAPGNPLPVIVSRAVEQSSGNDFTVPIDGLAVPVHVIGVASAFPSVGQEQPFVVLPAPGLLARMAAVPDQGFVMNEVWARGDSDPRPALARLGLSVGGASNARTIVGGFAQLPQSLAIGLQFVSAAAGLGLVVIGVAVALYFTQRRREYEFAALRAMGAETAQIRSALVVEQGSLLAFVVIAGFAIGYAMLRLMMPSLSTSLAVTFPRPVLVVGWSALALSVGAIVVAAGVSLALALRALVRSSVTGVLRGEGE